MVVSSMRTMDNGINFISETRETSGRRLNLYACNCKGDFLDGSTMSPPERFQSSLDFLGKLKESWSEHEKSSCKLSGTFQEFEGYGFLVTHTGGKHERNRIEDLLSSLRLALDDVIPKLQPGYEHRLVQFSLNDLGGPNWEEIRMTLEKILSEYPGIKLVPVSSPEMVRSTNLASHETATVTKKWNKVSSVEQLQSILDEMNDVELLYSGAEAEGELTTKFPTLNPQKPPSRIVQHGVSNVRNSIEIAKERKSREISSTVQKDRLPFTIFPQLLRRTNL